MNAKAMLVSALIVTGASSVSRAQGNVAQPSSSPQVEQDKAAVKSDTKQIKAVNETVKADKAANNTDKLKQDRVARRKLVHTRKQNVKKLKADEHASQSQPATQSAPAKVQ